MKFSEARIQEDAFTEIRNTFPETYGCLFHVANGASRDSVTASILTGQGVVPGIQDLYFIWAGKVYMIEAKDDKGTVSTDQKLIHATHKAQGFDTWLFRTSEQIIYFVKYIIEGRSLDGFKRFISPYSDASKVEHFRAELRVERKKKAEKKKRR